MSKERTPTSYLEDDWGMTPPGGTNASGAEKTPNYEYGNPYRAPMPETEDWGLGKDGMTSFGHSDTVKETKGATGHGQGRDRAWLLLAQVRWRGWCAGDAPALRLTSSGCPR